MVVTGRNAGRTIEYARETLRGEPPAAVAWVADLSRPHLIQFAVELSEAVRKWAVTGLEEEEEVIMQLLDAWEATAAVDADPELGDHLRLPREKKEYVAWAPGN